MFESNGGGDDFDAGFKVDSNDDPESSSKPESLSLESMTSISEKQTHTMVKIGRRQTEQSIANTAEVVSALNSRTSEMITTMNNINKSLIGISDRLDKLIKLQTLEVEEAAKAEDKNSVYDSNGNLSLSRIFDAAKGSASNNTYVNMAQTLLQSAGSLGPTEVAKQLLGFGANKKLDILDGQSINDVGKKFNETIGTAIQTGLGNLLKNDVFKNLFGDLTKFAGDVDYGTIGANNYNTKRAMFDGMTRMSIVNVIPEYLNKINQALTGEVWHVDSRGKLVKGAVQNKFGEVTKAAFASTGLSDNAYKGVLKATKNSLGDKLNPDDISMASRALTGAIVMRLHQVGTTFAASDLKRDMTQYVIEAVQVLCGVKNDPQYWGNICQSIIIQLSSGMMDSAKFVQNVNSSLKSMKDQAISYANSGKPEAMYAGKLSYNMMATQFIEENRTRSTPATDNKTDDASLKVQRVDQRNLVDGKYTVNDYIRGIFGILNRGINVKVLDKKKRSWKFDDYKLDKQSPTQENIDDSAAELFGSLMNGDVKNINELAKLGAKQAMEEMGANAPTEGVQAGEKKSPKELLKDILTGDASIKDVLKDQFGGILGKASEFKDKVSNMIPDRIKNDARFQQIQNQITGEGGIVDSARNRITDAFNNGTGAIMGSAPVKAGRRIANNLAYKHDSSSLAFSQDRVDHFSMDTDAIEDVNTRTAAEVVLKAIKDDQLDVAKEKLEEIQDENIKKSLKHHIDDLENIKKIKEKREKGQTQLANGETPDIGAVLQNGNPNDPNGESGGGVVSKILSVVKTGFKGLGKVLGTIAKFTAKMATRGVTDIVFGLKSMGGALIGNKRRDADGNVLLDENGNPIKSHGLLQNLTTDVAKIAKTGITQVGNKIKNSKFGQKVLNTTFTGQYERDANGNIVRDADGKAKLTNTATIGDLLKKPGETLAKSLKNIAKDIKDSKLGQTVKKLAESFKESGVGKALDGFAKKIGGFFKKDPNKPGLLQKAGDAVRKSRFGSGFMKGFDEAKKARNKLSKASEKTASFINNAVGNIMDMLAGKPPEDGGQNVLNQITDLLTTVNNSINNTSQAEIEAIEGAENGEEEGNENNTSTIDSGQTSGTTAEVTSTPDANVAAAAEGGGTPALAHAEAPTPTVSAGGGESGGEGGGVFKMIKSLAGDIMGNMGQLLGGLTQAVMGIAELVFSIIMGMEGLQAIKDAVMSILTDGLEPINGIFETILHLIQPVIDILKDAVSTIASVVESIASSVIDVLQPIMEAIQPLLKIIIDVCLAPVMIILTTLQPVIEGLGYTVEVLSGAVQFGLGMIIGLLGSILKGLGCAISAIGNLPIPGISGAIKTVGKGIETAADSMLDSATSMITTGKEQFSHGLNGLKSMAKSITSPADEPEEEKPRSTNNDTPEANQSGWYDMGSGDVINNSWTYTYGSGNTTMNQHTYGSYMNMSERGCGPVALADAYNRRNGGNMDPRTLASTMMGAGMYEPRRGTSAGSMVNAGSAIGMNMRVGGVTQQSLKRATPNNPITVLGSGAGFGTKAGNNHYVNVVGTDRNGSVYVSNPMSGRVERQSASNFALNAKLGLYGSGDNEYADYGFDENTTNAFQKLKDLTAKLTGMFQGPSEEDSINKQLQDAKNEQNAKNIQNSLDESEYEEVKKKVMDDLKAKYPKRDGESDEEYEARIAGVFEKEGNALIVKYGSDAYGTKMGKMYEDALSAADEAGEGYKKSASGMRETSSDSFGADANGNAFASQQGAVMAPYSPIRYTEPQIDGTSSDASPVHDFFLRTAGKGIIKAFTTSGGWFEHDDKPNKEGVGQSGNEHEGIGIKFTHGNVYDTDPAELHAITGGTVTWVASGGKHGDTDPNGGLGNHVKWRDDAGMYHWYLHMSKIDKAIKEGANIEPGQLIGYVGNTGSVDGNMLRYIVTSSGPYGSTGDKGFTNPLTYWKFEEGAPDGELVGSDNAEKIWNYLRYHGLSPEQAAGIMGNLGQESGFEPGNLQNSFESSLGSDADYTSKVNNKKYSKDQFSNDSGGYGLAQWTYHTRKAGLYDALIGQGKNIDDLYGQLEHLRTEQPATWEGIKAVTTPKEAASFWEHHFEGAGVPAMENRWRIAQETYEKYKNATVPASIAESSVPGSASAGVTGRFVSTISNRSGGNATDLVNAMASAFVGYINKDPSGKYVNGDIGSVTAPDGYVWDHFRPDCSGFTAAAMKKMGYTFKGSMNDTTGPLTYDFNENRNTSGVKVIRDANGNETNDWELIPFDDAGLQPGDILFTNGTGSTSWPCSHTDMFVDKIDGGGYACLDGGSTNVIKKSAAGGAKILDGSFSPIDLQYAGMQKVDAQTSGIILRYLGGATSSDPNDLGQKKGGFTHSIAGQNYGASPVAQMVIAAQNGIKDYSDSAWAFDKWGNDTEGISDYLADKYSGVKNDGTVKSKREYIAMTKDFDNASSWRMLHKRYTGIGLNNKSDLYSTNEKQEADAFLAAVKSASGSGDFWTDALMKASDNSISSDIPDIDPSKFSDSDFVDNQTQQFVQKYVVVSDNSSKTDMLDKMSKMTFNVRAQRVEELLEELIEKVDGNKPTTPKPANTSGYDPNLFKSNAIPEQITRLARG